MIKVPLKPFLRRRRRKAATTPRQTPAALMLTAAVYEEMAWVELTFDRAIDITNVDVEQVEVDDPVSGLLWTGTGEPLATGANSVRIELADTGASASGSVVLNASAETGIVAVDDGGTWAGATELGLPYP